MIAAIRAGNSIFGKKTAPPPTAWRWRRWARIGRSYARKADAITAAAPDLILNFHWSLTGAIVNFAGRRVAARNLQKADPPSRLRGVFGKKIRDQPVRLFLAPESFGLSHKGCRKA